MATTNGNCYICRATVSKTAMKNHILKNHVSEGNEECVLLKVEGAYAKSYWLYIDLPKTKTLTAVDKFLRDIWLECCGHMSEFSVGKSKKLERLNIGDKITYQYDFGTTTKLLITVVAETKRPAQKSAVRLLARNVPNEKQCGLCKKPATLMCIECLWEGEFPCLCESCAEKHENKHVEGCLPITNSPRCGDCVYDGENDVYGFDDLTK
jgi:hypothetical protein